jgi:hypothetical protein
MAKKKRKYTKRSPKWAKFEKLKRPNRRASRAPGKKFYERKAHTFVLSFQPAGMQHFPHSWGFEVGERIVLIPVESNPHDPFAIMVAKASGGDIGWFPRIDPDNNYHTRRASSVQQLLHRAIKGRVAYHAQIIEYKRGVPPTIALYLVGGNA